LAGQIKVDASIASEALGLVNSAVFAGGWFESAARPTVPNQVTLWLRRKIGPPIFGPEQKWPVADPGTSCHEAGFCIDIGFSESAFNVFMSDLFPIFGSEFINKPSDLVHFESKRWSEMSKSDQQQAISNAQDALEGDVPPCSSPLPGS